MVISCAYPRMASVDSFALQTLSTLRDVYLARFLAAEQDKRIQWAGTGFDSIAKRRWELVKGSTSIARSTR